MCFVKCEYCNSFTKLCNFCGNQTPNFILLKNSYKNIKMLAYDL